MLFTSKISNDQSELLIESTITPEELANEPVQRFQAFQKLQQTSSQAERLGIFLNIAKACEQSHRAADALGALHRAARMLGEQHGMLADLIAQFNAIIPTDHLEHLPTQWRIVHAWQNPYEFNQIIGHEGSLFCNYLHPGARFGGILGRPELANSDAANSLQNASFHVFIGDQHVATVPLVVNGQHILGGVINHSAVGCLPSEIVWMDDRWDTQETSKHVLQHIIYTARLFGADTLLLGERVREDLRLANLFAPQVRYATELWSRPIVDLTVSIDDIFTNLRKSYKSQINWGKKNLHNEYLSGDQLTDAKIVELYDLLHRLNEDVHSKYGNGMTKELFLFPILSCRRSEGEVTLTRDQDQIIGLTVTTDLNQVTYYALGAYIKSGNKSAAHFMLFDAIERAQKRGNTEFALNRAFGSPESLNQSANVRNRNIIFFKSGFANQTKYTLAYQVKVPSIPLNA